MGPARGVEDERVLYALTNDIEWIKATLITMSTQLVKHIEAGEVRCRLCEVRLSALEISQGLTKVRMTMIIAGVSLLSSAIFSVVVALVERLLGL